MKKSELRQIIREEIQKLNEGSLRKNIAPELNPEEKSWSIKEKLPIKVVVKKSSWSNTFNVIAPPMKMTYKTYEYLDHNHRQQDIGVSYGTYDYETGEAHFTAETVDDLDKWFKKYKKYVKPANDYHKLK